MNVTVKPLAYGADSCYISVETIYVGFLYLLTLLTLLTLVKFVSITQIRTDNNGMMGHIDAIHHRDSCQVGKVSTSLTEQILGNIPNEVKESI